jgi:hypothetical protein
MAWEHDIQNVVGLDTEEFDIIVSNKSLNRNNSLTNLVISNKLALTTFIAFAMIAIAAMAATTIVTQEAYADSLVPEACGIPHDKNTNYQGAFHVSPGFPSLSIPPGYSPWTPLCLPDNTKTQSDH